MYYIFIFCGSIWILNDIDCAVGSYDTETRTWTWCNITTVIKKKLSKT